jgi:hypothetical protein
MSHDRQQTFEVMQPINGYFVQAESQVVQEQGVQAERQEAI